MGSGSDRRSAAPEGARRFALPQEFYADPAETVARALLGCRLVSLAGGARCAGEIVETEAYTGPLDEASHAHERFGITPRNRVMFGPPGTAYVYRIYGIHWCFNAVTGPVGYGAAVLIRALRPLEGMEAARARRGDRPDRQLMRGPGNLCRALGIEGTHNEHALSGPPVWIEAGTPVAEADIARGPRVGISRAVEHPLRFWIRGSPWVSAGPPEHRG